jgi:hypothetical protein
MFSNLNPFGKSSNEGDDQVKDEQINHTDTNQKKGLFAGIKDKATAKMLEKQLAQVPENQREVLKTAIQNNPEFFEKLANKIKDEEKRNGGNQMAASMKVMREHQSELAKLINNQ